MNTLIFEHPLNEKIRGYLRLEYLDQQLEQNLAEDHQARCFDPLFSLCELTERCDYRGEVLKDLDRQLAQWSMNNAPTLDSIPDPVTSLKESRNKLKLAPRPGIQIKNDRFLSTLRQRYNMPGACCNFDLPQLHFWLEKPWEQRQMEYRGWKEQFSDLLTPIKLLLTLTRHASHYKECSAHDGFFQAHSEHPLSLVRIKLDPNDQCYPTISGHKNRYAIHFMQFDNQKHASENIPFQLATC
ncbi:cell division protein ZapD [uncultured Shewanella sp.]|uniref:cell division protein ZapD n=1 Tax=uncultured Shewanella sp. TaxID=173975 RepID=UPI002614E38A|nr:cell division protein ZapD [uncultured Shewanella sp.]